ncbi:MAG: TerB family tellurite resistance protein [Alphaproteobacteria bacterium]|nr:TerB family tellurite resistance protein [Alphaproteobacteria bacterium]
MLARLKRFLDRVERGGTPAATPRDELAVAVAVLLAKVAALDGRIDASERAAAADRLTQRFGVPRDEVEQIMDEAARTAADAVDLYGFTRIVKDRLDHDGRLALMEALWEVVYADGTLHDYEAQTMRRLAGLLYVPDRESGEARKRARENLGLDEAGPTG